MHKRIFKLLISLLLTLAILSVQARVSTLKVSDLMNRAIADHAFPGACIQVGNQQGVLLNQCFGHYRYTSQSPADNTDSMFDIASLTKIIATTTVVMKLYQQHRIDLQAQVSQYLPAFKHQVTIEQLLDHSSGEPAGIKPPYTWQHILHQPLQHTPGTHYQYSDVNFVILQKVLESICHKPFDQLIQKWVISPLQFKHTTFKPLQQESISTIVPTVRQGVVDDPLARGLGGIAGNAGLFSNIDDMGRYARMLLNQGEIGNQQYLLPSTIEKFTMQDHAVAYSSRGLGFDTVYDVTDKLTRPRQFSAGQYINPHAFGHTGYTGTSLWVSPVDNLYMVLLTNRVYDQQHNVRNDRFWRQQLANSIWLQMGRVHQNLTFTEPYNSGKIAINQ